MNRRADLRTVGVAGVGRHSSVLGSNTGSTVSHTGLMFHPGRCGTVFSKTLLA